VQGAISLEARSITGKLSALKSALESARPPSQIIVPALQWAQSPDSVFLNVKFSHKMDAPATLDVVVDQVEFTNRTLRLRASKERKAFELDLALFGAIDPERSTWTLGSVGRITVTLAKQLADDGASASPKGASEGASEGASKGVKWGGLLAPGAPRPKGAQMHLWWDRQKEFEAALEKLEDDGEDEEPEKAPKKSGKKASKKAKKKAKKKAEKDKAASAAAAGGEEEEESGFLGEALRAINAEAKDALAKIDAEAKRRRAEIDAEARERRQDSEAQLAEERRVHAAALGAKRQAAKEAEVAEANKAVREAKLQANKAGYQTREAPGPWAGKEGSHAPVLHLERAPKTDQQNNAPKTGSTPAAKAPPGGSGFEAALAQAQASEEASEEVPEEAPEEEAPQEEAGVLAMATVGHGMAKDHWIDLLWVEDEAGTVLGAKRFPAPSDAPGAAPGRPVLQVPVPPGARTVTAMASCNLHGVWASAPAQVNGVAALGEREEL